MDKLLEIKNLHTSFFTHVGEVKAVRGINIDVYEGEAIGIVGESGCGKSVTSLSVMGLVPSPGKVIEGQIHFKGEDLLKKSEKEMQKIRGNKIAMIFQDPMTSLNPVYTIGDQLIEPLRIHKNMDKEAARQKAIELLREVRIPDPERRLKQYPHEFSGGMRQRVMIAMALSCQPELVIADEPTTALDVTIQAQILELMKELKEKFNTSIMLITHDLGIVADLCSRIVVMYAGVIVEEGAVRDIFYNPKHPYTWGLLKSIPKVNMTSKERLVPIDGQPPDLLKPPAGCPFVPRCRYAMRICQQQHPALYSVSENHRAACWLLDSQAPPVEWDREGVSLK
ncbi:MAG: ABC transporter ATP-binding protein [Clostridiales bacterium]|nr:ABC transporter ATP-binding protein [Clostridiales bacterium]